jgi:hypothetical protein
MICMAMMPSMIATGIGGWMTVLIALLHLAVGVFCWRYCSVRQISQALACRGLWKACWRRSLSSSLVSRSLMCLAFPIDVEEHRAFPQPMQNDGASMRLTLMPPRKRPRISLLQDGQWIVVFAPQCLQ